MLQLKKCAYCVQSIIILIWRLYICKIETTRKGHKILYSFSSKSLDIKELTLKSEHAALFGVRAIFLCAKIKVKLILQVGNLRYSLADFPPHLPARRNVIAA
jgi:hypothetical protein